MVTLLPPLPPRSNHSFSFMSAYLVEMRHETFRLVFICKTNKAMPSRCREIPSLFWESLAETVADSLMKTMYRGISSNTWSDALKVSELSSKTACRVHALLSLLFLCRILLDSYFTLFIRWHLYCKYI